MAANSRTARTSRPVRTANTTPEAVDDFSDQVDETTEADAQEREATGQYVTVALCGEPIRVVPAGAWPVSVQRILRTGDLDGFMRRILHEEDYDLYVEIDPTQDEFIQFQTDVHELSGEPQGKSHGPSRSYRRTRRR